VQDVKVRVNHMSRTGPHIIETKSKDIIRSKIDKFYQNGDALYRELTERDYGIDALIELFKEGNPTGSLALLQIKGTEKKFKALKRKPYISIQISTSNAKYGYQNNIPIMLLYVNTLNDEDIYYVKLQEAVGSIAQNKIKEQKEISINIPISNCIKEDLEPFFETIRCSYRNQEEST